MQDGNFTHGDVLAGTTRVMVNGVHRPHVDVSWEGTIDGDLPAQVLAATGVKERSGQVEFAHSAAVIDQADTPWTGWAPQRGDRVEIWDDVDTAHGPASYRRFTGRIDDVWGDEDLSASIVDDWDLYRRPVTVLPMQKYMPGVPVGVRSSSEQYWAHLTAWGPVYKAIEYVGRGILPPWNHPSGRTVLHASFQGAVAPDVGGVMGGASGTRYDSANAGVSYLDDITIAESYEATAGGGTSNLGIIVRASREVFTKQNTAPYVTVTGVGSGESVSVYLLQWNRVQIVHGGTVISDQTVDWGDNDLIGVSVLWTADRIYVYSIGSGQEVSAASPGRPPSLANASCRVRWCAGVRVTRAQGVSAWRGMNHELLRDPISYRRPDWGGGLDATRLIHGDTAEQVLSEYAKRQLMSIWLDEHGTMQIWGASRLAALQPVASVATDAGVAGLPWRQSWASVRSSVRCTYLEAALTRSRYWGVAVWQDSTAKQLSNGEVDQTFAEPASDEDWLDPDFSFRQASGNFATNVGDGSLWGATYSVPEVTDGAWAYGRVRFEARQIGPAKVVLEHSVYSLPPDGRVHLRTPPVDSSTSLWHRWRDQPLPIIRGRGLTKWTDNDVPAVQAGPDWAPEFVHDFDWWGRQVDAEILRDWLAPQLDEPIATLNRLDVPFDPRRQLGDTITIDAVETHGVTFTALVVGIHETRDTSGPSQHLDLRVKTTVVPEVVTYNDERQAHDGTYADDRTIRAGRTYQHVRTNPLEGL